MKIIVIGAGELGRLLASALSEEDHDVVIVDSDADELARISDKLDAMTISGSCSSVRILKQALQHGQIVYQGLAARRGGGDDDRMPGPDVVRGEGLMAVEAYAPRVKQPAHGG